MLTACEQKYYERMPNLMLDLIAKIEGLSNEVYALKEELEEIKSGIKEMGSK